MQNENLGPAERIIQSALSYTDHLYHGRCGMVTKDTSPVGVKWAPVTHKEEDGKKIVYRLDKVGKKTSRVKVGELQENGQIKEGRTIVGEYRKPGLFPEVAAFLYRQVAEVWKLDNEFAARWASYVYGQQHRDFKVVLASFMLVQSRKGDPILDEGKVAFHDDDFRDVGEAMMLTLKKGVDMDPKTLLRMHSFLTLPGVAEINRELGFTHSARRPFLGRWTSAVHKWLRHREENTKLLLGLVKAGFRTTVMELAQRSGYKPESPKFFEVLRWKQVQAKGGHRTIAIGEAVAAAETWEGLSETQICQKIVEDRLNFKRLVGLVPKELGLTRAIVAAAVEANAMSKKDLIIFTPTLEDLGLLKVQSVREKWEEAVKSAEDMRAANIASRVKHKETQEKLQEAADTSLKKAVEEATRNMRIYLMVDVSSSMSEPIKLVQDYLAKFLQAFPLDRIHVSVFNSQGRVVEIKQGSAAGVKNAFRGIVASGGTSYAAGVWALRGFKPKADEDTLFIFFGDEEDYTNFAKHVRDSGLNPMAFGLVRVGRSTLTVVRDTAATLGIPCFMLDNSMFDDVYAIPRTLRALVASTPVGTAGRAAPAAPRLTLVEQVLQTELLPLPVWAAA